MSELGLSVDELPQPGKHRASRQRRPPPKQKKRRGGRSFLAFLMVLLVLGGLGAGGWYGVIWLQGAIAAEDYPGTGLDIDCADESQADRCVLVEVQEGMNLADIGQVLAQADVVKSQRAFVEASNTDPRAVNVQAGFYRLPLQLSAAAAIETLLVPASLLTPEELAELGVIARITIPEGLSSFRTFALIATELEIPLDGLTEAAADPLALGVPDFWFNRQDGKEVEEPHIEGFLFPSTYEFPPNPTAEQVLETMVSRFIAVADEIGFVETVESDRNISPYEALIVASLAQAEAGVEEDLGKVARVAYNRVYRETLELGCYKCLQFDVTVNYWFELNGEPTKSSDEMTIEELTDPDNPYNRNAEGLVPTPINNPGEAALRAAMEPPEADWLYFVAVDEEGNSLFADTLAEHCQNVAVAVQNDILSESALC